MNQIPDRMGLDGLEQRSTRELAELRNELDARITALENPASATVSYAAPPNLLPNSYCEYSTMGYTTAGITPATAGDTNFESYNWKQHTTATTDVSGGTALVGSGHSTYAGLGADIPRWDRTNGGFVLGSSTTNYDISCQLPSNFVKPGQRYYVYLEAAVTQTDTDINGVEFYCGFHDNTAGQRKWIEGTFAPTAQSQGVKGTRTLKYKIHARTDSGSEMLSSEITITDAPATLTPDNRVKLDFSGQPGFIEYTIYRKDGSNYYRVGQIRNSIDLQFLDWTESGPTVVPVTGYPSVSGTTPKAYAQTLDFTPADVGSFATHTLTIQVPASYDSSVTGNLQQYFRFGLTGLVASGSEHEVTIRKISLSEGYGQWSRSALDLQALSGPSSSATSGTTGGGGVVITPPTGGSGGPRCLTLDMDVLTSEGLKRMAFVEKGDFVKCGLLELPVTDVKTGTVQFVWEFETECGKVLRCSDTHRLITSLRDRRGRSAKLLKEGDTLLTEEGNLSRIVRKTQLLGEWTVKQITLPTPHKFVANGLVSHNRKAEDDVIIVTDLT